MTHHTKTSLMESNYNGQYDCSIRGIFASKKIKHTAVQNTKQFKTNKLNIV